MMSVCGSAAILPSSSAAMTVLTTTSSQAQSLEDRKALRNRKKRQNRRRAKAGKDLGDCVVVTPPRKKEPAAREEEEGQEGGTKLAPSPHNKPQKTEQKEKKRKKQKSNKGREVVSSLRLLLRLCWLLRPELRLMAFATVASITVALMNILSNLYIGTIVGVITASPNLHHSPHHNTTLSSSYPSINSTSSSYDPSSSFSAAAVADLASAIPTGSLPSLFLPSRENTSFDRYCLLLLLILASHALFYGIKVSLFSIAAEHFSVRLKTSVLDSLLKQEVGFFDKRGIGDLISRLNTDTDTIKDAISSQIAELIMSLLTILGGVLFLLSLSWKLTVVLLCSSPIMGVAMGLQSKFGSAYTEQELEAAAKATDRAEETLSNIRLVHACCREDYHKDKYRMALNLVFELKQRLALMNGMFETLTWFIMNGSMVGCVWYAGKLVGSGDLLTSEMLSYVLFATDVVLYVGYLPQTISQLAKGVGAGKRMFHLLDRKPKHTLLTSSSPSSIGDGLFSSETEITSPQAVAAATNGLSRSRNSSSTNLNEKKGVKDEEDEEDDVEYTNSNNNSLSSSENENENEDESEEELVGRLAVDARPSSPSPFSFSSLSSSSSPTMLKQQDKIRIPDHEFKGVVEFQDVRFSYPTRKGVRVLSNISFTIPAGTSLGIVGRTGCGKSTLISLLLRFYSVQQGRVLIDGYDLEHLDIKWFRNHVGVVMQNNQLFSGTIADNIRYGRPDATMEEVKEAAKQANIHSFIESLPAQYDTSVGQKGVTFSGGQRQRICIARAILKNPKILLLDEATSALDSHSERLVQEALNRLMVGRTTVVIAHRLNTLNDLDRLLVMNAGQIVEDGAPSDLMSDERSLFRKLLLQSP